MGVGFSSRGQHDGLFSLAVCTASLRGAPCTLSTAASQTLWSKSWPFTSLQITAGTTEPAEGRWSWAQHWSKLPLWKKEQRVDQLVHATMMHGLVVLT